MARGLFACFPKRSSNAGSTDVTKSRETPTDELSPEELKHGGAVVVELFSSQGCATSPEAELLFSRLGRGDFNLEIPVILMAYHVDYWDFNGWKDPFGSSQWTVRQKGYVESLNLDTMFTPQVVVQGRRQFVGNDEESLLSSVAGVPRYAPPAFQATFQRPTPESLQVSLKGSLRAKMDGGADVMVAVYESGLVTECKNGDNKGRVIANDFVVKKLSKIWSFNNVPHKKTLARTIDFDLWDGFNSAKCGIVVFVQQHGTHHIFGSQQIQLPANI
ncbi:hypothetical protein R6Q59_018932 [Mikania micrantha]|uniref:Thioredoxin-like fold domain-containing protein n=1 Tax=Mikania micrantha TaxID=192012 RepID=A0A5N6LZ19_9ASTR|nr:hypothetical protein E3N88_34759 [Mikania micrantha]